MFYITDIFSFLCLFFIVLMLAVGRIFEKAGKPKGEGVIPIFGLEKAIYPPITYNYHNPRHSYYNKY